MLWAVLVALLATPLAQAAEPLVLSQAYWMDETGKATLGDALKAPFAGFDGSLALGFRSDALWVRLRIAGQPTGGQLALIVEPAFIRRIELYDPQDHAGADEQKPVVSGRDAEITAVNHIGLDNGFVIPASREPRDIFLRLTTTTTLAVDVELRTLDDAEHGSQLAAGILAVYFAFLSAFLLWSVVTWAVRRDLLYGLFALRLTFSMLHLFVMSGLLRYFFASSLGAPVRDQIYNLVLVSIIAVTASFDFKLISEFGVPRWLQKLAWSLLGLPVLCLVVLLLGHTREALWLNTVVVSIIVIMNVILAFSARDLDKTPFGGMAITTIRVGYVLMALVVLAPTLIVTNILHAGVPVIKLVFLHAVITTVILFAILSIRARQSDLLAQEAVVQYQVKERELRQESERRAEKERFLSMLVHELRNPLSVIQLRTSANSSGGKAVHQAAQAMAQIIERVEQSETLDHAAVQGRMASVNLVSVVREVAMDHPASSRLAIDAPADLTVATDEDLFRSIVRNLLDNAWKYSPDDSPIRMALAADTLDGMDGARLSIANETGDAGTPDSARLFTKYYRSKGAHRRPGSGLGLFLVAGWAKALGGKVGYEQIGAANGRATVRFSLWLPT